MAELLKVLLYWFIEVMEKPLGKTLTATEAIAYLALFAMVLIIVLFVTTIATTKKYKKLKKRIINGQIQVVSVSKGRRGKTKRVVRTKEQLKNPTKNNKLTKPKKNKNNLTVVNIKED